MIRRDVIGRPVNPVLRWIDERLYGLSILGLFLLLVLGIAFLIRHDNQVQTQRAAAAEVFGKYRARLDNGGRLTAAEEEEYARAMAILQARGGGGGTVVVPVPRVGK